ncbi:MAG: hypothetical protein SPI12_04345 [Actinomycetaceae bacterium]|nr:hypothetical protein [Actinomycetaceae bacterium]MDY6083074.1 hypothetical protein [Actinomycetaceae bacterium]
MASEEAAPLKIMVYSDNSTTRAEIKAALGNKVAADLPPVAITEVATAPMVVEDARQGDFSLLILDAEAAKLGGMGVGKMVQDEVDPSIPFMLVLGRPQDEWLARWSGADASVYFPINPRVLAQTAADVIRRHSSVVATN